VFQDYHYGLVVTRKKDINTVLSAKGYDILSSIIFCIFVGPEHELYDSNLLVASMNLYTIGILIYKGKNGYKKLSKRKYEVEIFEAFGETQEEVNTILNRLGFRPTSDELEYVYNVLYAIKPLLIEWISYTHEIVFEYEFAYHIDYCIRNKVVQLPEPNIDILFPTNFPTDYNINKVRLKHNR